MTASIHHLFICLFKINDRRARGPLILYTQIIHVMKRTKRKEKQTNKQKWVKTQR